MAFGGYSSFGNTGSGGPANRCRCSLGAPAGDRGGGGLPPGLQSLLVFLVLAALA